MIEPVRGVLRDRLAPTRNRLNNAIPIGLPAA